MPEAKNSRTPVWLAITRALQADISEGRYAAGDRLPTEHKLAERFGVNRHTVRRAISHLVDANLLRTRRGSGIYVAGTPTEYAIGSRVRFHENLLAGGHRPEKRVLQVETRHASKGEATALEMPREGTVCSYWGLSLSDGNPIALFESVFPFDRLPGIATALETTSSVTSALEKADQHD